MGASFNDNDVNPGGDSGGSGQGGSGEGVNPAWNDLLGIIPQELHNQVTPHLRNWDQGVNQRFQGIQEQYKPYKSFVDGNIRPEDLQMGYGLVQALNEDPARVYQAIAEHYGLSQGAAEEETAEEESGLPPEVMQKLQAFEQFQEQVSRLLVGQREQELAKTAEDALDKELSDLAGKFGDFDEQIVLPLMQNGLSGEQAVQRYFQIMDELATKASRPQVPRIIGSNGGGIPQGGVDPVKLPSNDVKKLVAQQLLASRQQG